MVGVPVTLYGDLKNQFVEANVGFDTICKVLYLIYVVVGEATMITWYIASDQLNLFFFPRNSWSLNSLMDLNSLMIFTFKKIDAHQHATFEVLFLKHVPAFKFVFLVTRISVLMSNMQKTSSHKPCIMYISYIWNVLVMNRHVMPMLFYHQVNAQLISNLCTDALSAEKVQLSSVPPGGYSPRFFPHSYWISVFILPHTNVHRFHTQQKIYKFFLSNIQSK